MRQKRNQLILLGSVAALSAGAVMAQPAGQWDFDNGNLAGTVGGNLEALGSTIAEFGTTTSFGIPNIGGTEAKVMKFPKVLDASGGFNMPVNSGPVGGEFVNSYTLVWDLLFPQASHGTWRALLNAEETISADGDFFVNNNNGIGIAGNYSGQILANTWHRVAMVVDAERLEIRKYIDGILVGAQGGVQLDDRFALSPGGTAKLFSDDDGETSLGYVNSIQLRAEALSGPQIRALGAASAGGIPQEIPPIPSGIEKYIPAGDFASRNTSVGAVIATGDSTVTGITVKLNGQTISGVTTTTADGMITATSPAQALVPGVVYNLEISYTDSRLGAKTFTHPFTAALFFEDFESVTLREKVDEPNGEGPVWTDVPPTGWAVDDTQMAGITSADDDGDGFPDGDGRTEWAGWSFALRSFWLAADDQRRSEFTLATGVVAIADPDEWDDNNHDQGFFNSFLKTPEISLAGVAANSAFLKFSSSWRPEAQDDGPPKFPEGNINNQTAIIEVAYDGGAPTQVLKWDSVAGSPTFHTDKPNEEVLIPLNNPAGAQKLVLTFKMVEAANDWWWAVDNIVINAGALPPAISKQPTPVEVEEGGDATLTVIAQGEGLSYQWYKGFGSGRTAVTGATGSSLNLNPAKIEHAGYYSVDVKNAAGTTPSGVAKVAVTPKTAGRLVLLNEDFNSVPLGPNVDEGLAGDEVWSKTGPAGWTTDDTGVPGVGSDDDGVTEWAGWSFASRTWWAQTAGDQQRTQFTRGTGTSAIVDSDEWDDIGHAPGNMDASLKSKPISLAGAKANSVIVKFDSSWRPEEPQKGSVAVQFDGGTPVVIYDYNSTPANPAYHPDETNETLAWRVNNPAGAQTMTIIWRYYDTRNNWWWAIDNVLVLADPAPIFFEDFESLVLGPNVDEALAGTDVWTSTLPTGWTRDTVAPGLDDPAIGVREWEGWNFAKRTWWAQTAGDQQRTQFTKGVGTVAVADGDEWDDKGDPDSRGKMHTFLSTRPINIGGQAAGSLHLKFDSSWRDEPDQKVNVRVSYDGGTPMEVLRWEASGPNFHDDATNESVSLALRNPAGAQSMVITFGYFDAGNNWWWAIDNIEVSVGEVVIADTVVSIQKVAGGKVRLSWDGPGSLQATTTLVPANWLPVSGGSGVEVDAGGTTQFFRVAR